MKLHTVPLYNLEICLKEDNIDPNYSKRDSAGGGTLLFYYQNIVVIHVNTYYLLFNSKYLHTCTISSEI